MIVRDARFIILSDVILFKLIESIKSLCFCIELKLFAVQSLRKKYLLAKRNYQFVNTMNNSRQNL